jgi:methionine synthase II (cobalamin-independent)
VFATLLGALPRVSGQADVESAIRTAVRAQEDAGLEPITDGRLRGSLQAWVAPDGTVDGDAIIAAWRLAAGATDRAVKQALPGPYSLGRATRDRAAGRNAAAREDRSATAHRSATTLAAAAAIREVVVALAAAGCPMVEIEETEAHLVGEDERERALFREAHQRLADGIEGTHLSLSIVGGSAWSAGLETIIDAPYASLAVDLIAGPDNWNLVTRLPGQRGVIAGALPAKDSPADAKELLVWAARHAAATQRRGLERVGLGSAGSWADLSWAAAVEKLHRLGEAARIASTPAGERLARQLDPRAVSARRAAMGHGPQPDAAGPIDRDPGPSKR